MNAVRDQELEKLERLLGIQLPHDYRAFLLAHNGSLAYSVGNEYWRLTPLVRESTGRTLLSSTQVDRWKGPEIKLLEGYATTLREFSDHTSDSEAQPYSFARLAKGLAIGSENADVLFLDPLDQFSVGRFFPDGGDIERLGSSFGDWLSKLAPVADF